MANESKNEAKLKLVHLVYLLITAAVVVGVWIGRLGNQQTINTDSIEKKVSKELFDMHQTQQVQQFQSLQDTISKGFGRVDTRLEAIERKNE